MSEQCIDEKTVTLLDSEKFSYCLDFQILPLASVLRFMFQDEKKKINLYLLKSAYLDSCYLQQNAVVVDVTVVWWEGGTTILLKKIYSRSTLNIL